MKLSHIELEMIIDGAALFGSGGGGSRDNANVFLEDIRKRKAEIELVTDIDEANPEALSCVICDIGANGEFDPRQIHALENAFERLEKNFALTDQIKYVFPIESGPENTMAPIVLASRKNLKVVDCDGGGRAVPKLSLTLFSFENEQLRPAVMSNGLSDSVVTSKEVEDLEKMLRNIVQFKAFNSSASLALWPEKATNLVRKGFNGPIMRSYYCGMMLKGIRENDQKLMDEALPHLNKICAYFIEKGIVIDKDQKDDKGFDRIETTLYNSEKDMILTIYSQNENLIVYNNRQHRPMAIAPDSICYLDTEFHALTNARVSDPMDHRGSTGNRFQCMEGKKKLQELFLIGIKAPPILVKNKRLMEEFNKVLIESNIHEPYETPEKGIPLGDLLLSLK